MSSMLVKLVARVTVAVLAVGMSGCSTVSESSGSVDTSSTQHIPDSLDRVPHGKENGEPVCVGEQEHIAVVFARSESEIDEVRAHGPEVLEQVVQRALTTCGSVLLGIAADKPAQTDLTVIGFTPDKRHALRAKPIRTKMKRAAEPQLAKFKQQLAHMTPAENSPFFSLAAHIAEEVRERNLKINALILVGDGIVVDRGIDARYLRVDKQRLAEFTHRMRDLPCTVMVGVTQGSGLPEGQLQKIKKLLRSTWARAGSRIRLIAGYQLPSRCGDKNDGDR